MRDQLLPIQGIKTLEWNQKHIREKVDKNLINNRNRKSNYLKSNCKDLYLSKISNFKVTLKSNNDNV